MRTSMDLRHIRWLYGELPSLVQRGLLTDADAARLRTHYGPVPVRSARRTALTVCSVLGGSLIGAGVILLLAHNWDQLARVHRTVLAIAPLLVAQALTLRQVWRGRLSAPWREGLGAFQALAVAAAIALVGQTYHMPGDLGDFLLTWMLLILPQVYLLRAAVPALIYLAGIAAWAGTEQAAGQQAALFWVLLAAFIPYFLGVTRRAPGGSLAAWLGWGLCLCLSVATGIALEKALPGLWLIVYSAMLSAFYLAGPANAASDTPWLRRPFHTVGTLGIAALALLLTYDWVWRDIGWTHYRWDLRFDGRAAMADYAVTAAALLTATLLFVRRVRVHPAMATFGGFFLLTTAGYACSALGGGSTVPMLLCNGFLLVTGVVTVMAGIRNLQLGTLNGGLALITMLLVARFFDSDLGFLSRGIAFIVIGAAFLAANLVMLRKTRREPPP